MGKHKRQKPRTRNRVWPMVMALLKKRNIPEKVARPTRTGAFIAAAGYLVSLWHEHVDKLTKEEMATAVGVVAVALNFIWVAAEDYLERGLMREVPPKVVPAVDGAAPAPEPPQMFDVR